MSTYHRLSFLLPILFFIFSNPAQADSEKLYNPITRHTYQHIDRHRTWADASDSCLAQKGYLVTITSPSESDWLISNELMDGWIGALVDGSGKWKWITGELWGFTNGYAGSEAAIGHIAADARGSWFSSTGDRWTSFYTCEWDRPIKTYTSMITADTDNDGSMEFILIGSKGATVKVFGYDHATKAVVSDVSFLAYPAYAGTSLSVMDDMNGNGYKELSLLMTKKADGSSIIQTRDGKNGDLLDSYKVPR